MQDSRRRGATRPFVGMLVGVLLLAGAPTASAAVDPSPLADFGGGAIVHVGDGARSVALGDVDGDSDLDLVLVNFDSDTVSVALGNGDGSLVDDVQYATADAPASVAVGDIDGDGDLDILTSHAAAGVVSILLGAGDGTFAAHTDVSVGGTPRMVTTGDVDGDGDLDLAISTSAGASVMLGNGDGSFGAPTAVHTVSGGSGAILLVDVNADTNLDLITCDGGSTQHNVSVSLGDGAGGFTLKGSSSVGTTGPSDVDAPDMNGDGKLDLVSANGSFSSSANNLSVLLGNGDGTFATHVDYPAGPEPVFSVAAGDLNGDGDTDVAAANFNGAIVVRLGRGDGTLGPLTGYPPTTAIALTLGDVNSDGFTDIAVTFNAPFDLSPDYAGWLVNTTGLRMAPPVATPGDGLATLSWTVPVAASSVTQYNVRAFAGYAPYIAATATFPASATSGTISGLTNCTAYRFQIRASNAVGSGPFSERAKTIHVGTVPSAPTIVRNAHPGDGSATASWDPPASSGTCPITGYIVTPYVGYYAQSPITFNSTETTQTVTGLTNGTTYRFRVQAFNIVGTSDYSKVTNPVTPSA